MHVCFQKWCQKCFLSTTFFSHFDLFLFCSILFFFCFCFFQKKIEVPPDDVMLDIRDTFLLVKKEANDSKGTNVWMEKPRKDIEALDLDVLLYLDLTVSEMIDSNNVLILNMTNKVFNVLYTLFKDVFFCPPYGNVTFGMYYLHCFCLDGFCNFLHKR